MRKMNGPPKGDGAPKGPIRSRGSATTPTNKHSTVTGRQVLVSQQVDWWSVHDFVAAVLNQVNNWPLLGTPSWCSLANDDPAKWAALLDAAQHHALRIETAQQALREASHDISAAADWSGLAREIRSRNESYIKRVAS
jgi:Protein of unknown function (DUF2742)